MKVIIGLGNPGIEYEFTRHNVGYRVVTQIAIKNDGHFSHKKQLWCDIAKVKLAGSEVLLVKPTTYMNDSGKTVLAVMQWYKVLSEEILVVHDDVSLPLGKLRFQKSGGAGGQHGVESIIECLGGSKDFNRLKLGVGPDPGGDKRADYVLSKIPKEQIETFEICLQTALESIEAWTSEGIQEAANRFNGIELFKEDK